MSESHNVFAAILAGGSGARMGNPDKPKQFLMLGDRPVLIHTVEKFCVHGGFGKVLVLCPEAWIRQTKDLIERYCASYADLIEVVAGGSTRDKTVMCAVEYIEGHFAVNADTVLVTHDAVRPFVSMRMIAENIEAAAACGACDTVIPATDTIVESFDGEVLSSIPNRSELYQGQTPQSFKMLKLKELFSSLNDDERAALTDACKIFTMKGEKVALVRGDVSNMKITYPHDMRVARALLGDDRA